MCSIQKDTRSNVEFSVASSQTLSMQSLPPQRGGRCRPAALFYVGDVVAHVDSFGIPLWRTYKQYVPGDPPVGRRFELTFPLNKNSQKPDAPACTAPRFCTGTLRLALYSSLCRCAQPSRFRSSVGSTAKLERCGYDPRPGTVTLSRRQAFALARHPLRGTVKPQALCYR